MSQVFMACVACVLAGAAAGPAQEGPATKIFLPAALRGASMADHPTPPAPDPGAPTSLVLNEVGFNPAQGGPTFVEILNPGGSPAGLEGVQVTTQLTDTFRLPEGLPALEPSALLVIYFDGQDRFESSGGTIRVHADRTHLMGVISDTLTLSVPADATRDKVAWGTSLVDDVPLGSGGATMPPPPGASIGRVPSATAGEAGEWAFYLPSDSSAGAENPLPAVDAFPMQDGLVVAPGAVLLEWYPQRGAARYLVQIAEEEAFSPILAEAIVDEPAFTTGELAVGEYFWRVQSVGPTGAASRFSESSLLTVEEPEPPIAIAAQVTLPVPFFWQKKDTTMLLVSRPTGGKPPQENGAHAWDVIHPELDRHDPADYAHCALATVAMMAAYRHGTVSQDRIGFELFRARAPGPEDDLSWGFGVPTAQSVELLEWAVGPGVIPYWASGASGDFSSPPTDLEREVFGDAVKLAIDRGQPLALCGGGHCVVIYGYTDGLLGLRLHVNDPWYGQRTMRASRIPLKMYATAPLGATGRLEDNTMGLDSDGDEVYDFDESERFGTSPQNADSDGDHVNDKKDIQLSIFDPDHGFAKNGDARSDIDGDLLAPELDFDSDNGGCSDGLEDLNRDGKIQPNSEETSPFDADDDRCIEGEFLQTVIQDGATESQITHVEIRHSVSISMMPTENGTVEGTGQAEYYTFSRSVRLGSDPCESTLGPFEVQWPVTITGRFTNDVLSFEVEPPSRTITVTPGGTCGSIPFEYTISHFVGWADITFTDGLYEWTSDTPFGPPYVGNTHVELKLRRKDARPDI